MFARFLLGLICCMAMAHSALAVPRVLVTLPPIHSITATVMEGVTVPELLLGGQANVHDFALRPSDIEKIQHADIIIYSGPQLEPQLQKTLQRHLHKNAQLVSLEDAKLKLRTKRTSESIDPHYWLDPENGERIAAFLSDIFSHTDPANAAFYKKNNARFHAQLMGLDQKIKNRLSEQNQSSEAAYISYHNPYRYMEMHYSLPASLALTDDPDLGSSPQSANAIERKISKRPLACIIEEKGFPEAGLARISKITKARTVPLDPEGNFYPSGKDLYVTMLSDITHAIIECQTRERDAK